MAHAIMLIDTSKCIGCKACQVACQQWHGKEAEDTEFTGSYTNPPDKSGANFTVVKYIEHVDSAGVLRFVFFPDRCRHCLNPVCKAACPASNPPYTDHFPPAIHVFPWGGVAINENRCNIALSKGWCNKECELACPYKTGFPPKGVPRFEYEKNGSTVSLPAQKCDFCYDRFRNEDLKGENDPPNPGEGARFKGEFAKFTGDPPFSNRPACEVACPTGAIRCGMQDQVLPYARNRVNALQTDGFPDANLYPSTPEGGINTHMVWVLTEKPYVYGL